MDADRSRTEVEAEIADLRRLLCRVLAIDEENATFFRDGLAGRLLELFEGREGDLNFASSLRGNLDAVRFLGWFRELEAFRSLAGSTVVVVGCGSGPELLALERLGAAYALGLDVDPRLVGAARDRATPSRGGALLYDGVSFPLRAGVADVVILSHVLEHVSSPAEVLAEGWRILRPRGLLYVETPNRWAWREQHTQIPLIAWLPAPWRRRLAGFCGGPRFPFLRDATKRLLLGMVTPDFHTFSRGDLEELVARLEPRPTRIVRHAKDGRSPGHSRVHPVRVVAHRFYVLR